MLQGTQKLKCRWLQRVIWSNETKINRFHSDGKEYYWHHPYERLKTPSKRNNETWTRKFDSVGLFYLVESRSLWANRRHNEKRGLTIRIIECKISDFVEECAYPEEEIIFQQDGDPKHMAKIVKDWLSAQKFQTMQWPEQSPDFSPIGNLWALLKKMSCSIR